MQPRWLALAVLTAVALYPGAAAAKDRVGSSRSERAPERSTEVAAEARSIGSPTEGRLEGAEELEVKKEIRLRNPSARWGLPALVGLIERSAKRVAQRFEGAVVVVGDLSRKGGGSLAGHRSHESGRDADVGFLFVGPDGQSALPGEFLAVDANGVALANRSLRFDDARNWALIEAWITDPSARVEHIFVADRLRTRLLQHARAKGAYLPVLHRAALAMKQPSRGLEHDDHFHVRIACPRKQRQSCVALPDLRGAPRERDGAPILTKASGARVLRWARSRPKPAARALVKRGKQGETTRQ